MNVENTSTAVFTTTPEKPTKPKRTDEEKLPDCYVQMSKLLEQQTVTRQKSKDIDSRIYKLNSKIQEYENKALYKICKKLNITTKDLIEFLDKIPKDTSFDEFANRALRGSSEHHNF